MDFLSRFSLDTIIVAILLAIALLGAHVMYNPFTRKASKSKESNSMEERKTRAHPVKGIGGRREFRRCGSDRRRRIE